jgi:sugar phosphate permease
MTKSKKWFVLTTICFGGGIVFILPYIQYSYYDSLMEALKLDHQQMGDMMSLLGIISSIAYLVGGIFADKFNVKWLISVSLVITGVGGLWFASFPSYGALLCIMVIYGISTILMYWPAMIKAVKLLGTEDEQGRMFGFREAGFGIFAWIFTQLGTWLIFNRTKGIEGVQHILIFYSIIYFVAGILSFVLIPNSRKMEQKQIDNKDVSVINGVLYVIKLPSVWIIGMAIFCAYTISGPGLGKLTPYFTKILKVDETLVASLMSFRMYLLAFVAASIGGIIVDKLKSASRFLFVSYILLVLTMLLLILLPGKVEMAVMVIIAGFLASTVIYGMRGTYMAPMGQARIPDEYIGTAAGLISFIGYLPDAFMFSFFGKMMGNDPGESEFKAIFMVCAGLAVVGVVLSLIMMFLIKKRQQEVPLSS